MDQAGAELAASLSEFPIVHDIDDGSAKGKRQYDIQRTMEKDILPELVARHPGLSHSFEGHQAEIRDSTSSLITGLGLALLCVYGLLAIPFKSYIQPVIIMFCIPFGMIGAVVGHVLMGYSLALNSLFGMVALSGVVVNDSLLLIDFANRRRQSGSSPFEAIQSAGIQRFRPVLLTTLTTFGGLTPMMLETSLQARFMIPMAISLGFGILFATFITLVMVPCLYLLLEDLKLWVGLSQAETRNISKSQTDMVGL